MMLRPRPFRYIVASIAALAIIGCDASNENISEHAHVAAPLGDQEDAVCGMLVREQSAPRGQVVHHDGTRFFFCSLGDMLVHLGGPSPHGRPEAVYVEVMEPEEDPMQSHTGEHPWLPAEDAIYAVGVERQRIMGEPVLAYANREHAERAIEGRRDALLLDMAGLRKWWEERSTREPAPHP
jgi:nitrous oxide reductase accessory protein NosL